MPDSTLHACDKATTASDVAIQGGFAERGFNRILNIFRGSHDVLDSERNRIELRRLEAEAGMKLAKKNAANEAEIALINARGATQVELEIVDRESAILERTKQRFVRQQVAKQENREKLAEEIKRLPTPDISPGTKFDEDLMRKIGDASEDVTDEDVRKYLAKLALTELRTPKSFHPMTLATLVKLRSDDLEALALLCKITWTSLEDEAPQICWPVDTESLFTQTCLTMAQLNNLKDSGLLEGFGPQFTLTTTVADQMILKYAGRKYAFFKSDGSPAADIPIGAAYLTRAGQEIMRVMPEQSSDTIAQITLQGWRAQGFRVNELQ